MQTVSFKEGTPRYLGHTFRYGNDRKGHGGTVRAEQSLLSGSGRGVFVRKKNDMVSRGHGESYMMKDVKLYQNDMWYAWWGLNTPSVKRNYACVSKMTGPQQDSCFCYVFGGNYYINYIDSFVSSGPSILKRPPMVRIDTVYMICLCLFWVFLAGG